MLPHRGDFKEAVTVVSLLPLAEQGVALAQTYLGVMYAKGGGGVAQDYKEAVKWWRLSAEQGNTDAKGLLDLLTKQQKNPHQQSSLKESTCQPPKSNGGDLQDGVDAFKRQDYKEAVRLFHLSAEQGNAEAQFILGTMYASGRGVPQDYKEAVKWYRLSAEQGHGICTIQLGK